MKNVENLGTWLDINRGTAMFLFSIERGKFEIIYFDFIFKATKVNELKIVIQTTVIPMPN